MTSRTYNMNDQPNHNHSRPTNQNQDQNHFYHNYSTYRSSSASFKGCCCWLFILLTFLGLLILSVILVIILVVKPKKPQFELEQVGVQFVGVTAAPPVQGIPTSNVVPSASLSFTIRLVFTAVNPNKVGIKYSQAVFDVMYRGVPVGRASVPGFYQPAHSVRQVETTVGVDRVNLLQTEATELVKDAFVSDRVELKIAGDVGAQIRILDFTSPGVEVSVDCIIVISPKKKSLTYKQCGVDGLNV